MLTRLKNENSVENRGSGLGRYLTKYIIVQHRGKVWAESVPEEWTKLGFSFPEQVENFIQEAQEERNSNVSKAH